MASVGGFSELTNFEGRFRLMGLNNNIFNTNDLVDAEIQMLDAKIQPQKVRRDILTEEKTVWTQFKNDFSGMTDVFKDLRMFNVNQKQATYSKEGFITLETGSNSLDAEYNISVSQMATRHQVSGANMGSSDSVLGLTDDVQLNGKTLSIGDTMTLRDVVKEINNGDFGISASIISNRLVLTSKEYGESNQISLTDGANGALKALGVLNADDTIANELSQAKDAILKVNGIDVTSSSNEISNAIDGAVLKIQNVTTGDVKATVKGDSTEVMKKVEEAVNKFNDSIRKFAKYTDKGTYLQGQTLPLTVRRAMSEISNFSGTEGTRLFQMGIELDGTTKDGTLKFDKTKLEEQFKNNPQIVMEMFFGENGLGKYMEDKIKPHTSSTGTIQGKIDGLQGNIDNMNEDITRFESIYDIQKQSILKKYAAFETMMSRLNGDLAYMEAQISAMNGSKK